jgi:hypothetical protein
MEMPSRNWLFAAALNSTLEESEPGCAQSTVLPDSGG